jgi:Protein of unknown function (DUF4231)
MEHVTTEDRRKKAVERYSDSVRWYERTKRNARVSYYTCQVAVIVLSGITPLVILATDKKLIQAVLPALAAICAGISGIYQWRESWRRRAATLENLKSEYVKFDTRSGDDYSLAVPEDEAISRFVLKMEAILESEVSEWQRLRVPKSEPGAG